MNFLLSMFAWLRDLRRRSFAEGQEASALEYRAVLQTDVLEAQAAGFLKARECLALAREGLDSTDELEREIAEIFRQGLRETNLLGRSILNGATPLTGAERQEALATPSYGSTKSGSDLSNRAVAGPSSNAKNGSVPGSTPAAFTRPATPTELPRRPRGRPRKGENGMPPNGEAETPTRPLDVPPEDPVP
jgi:hypothetical protein